MLKLIFEAFGRLARQVWLLPQSIASSVSQRQNQVALNEQEAERLDRLRNPSKYLGK